MNIGSSENTGRCRETVGPERSRNDEPLKSKRLHLAYIQFLNFSKLLDKLKYANRTCWVIWSGSASAFHIMVTCISLSRPSITITEKSGDIGEGRSVCRASKSLQSHPKLCGSPSIHPIYPSANLIILNPQ